MDTKKSILALYRKIRTILKGSWMIFIISIIVVLVFFFWLLFRSLGQRVETFSFLFNKKLLQTEEMFGDGNHFPIPLSLSGMKINGEGVIIYSTDIKLEGLNLDSSGMFRKISTLKTGKLMLLFYPDPRDGIRKLYIVKRFQDEYVAGIFDPKDFFLVPETGNITISLTLNDVVFYSTDAGVIGNIIEHIPFFIKNGRTYVSLEKNIALAESMVFHIHQNITLELSIVASVLFFLTAGFVFLSFMGWQISGEISVLQKEHRRIIDLVRDFSGISMDLENALASELDILINKFQVPAEESVLSGISFSENRRYISLVIRFALDIINLLIKIRNDAKILIKKNEELEELIFISSHDLRTPLINIGGFSGELELTIKELNGYISGITLPREIDRGVFLEAESRLMNDFKQINENLISMNAMLDGLIRISDIGTRAIRIIPIDMNLFADNIIRENLFQLEEHHFKVTIDPLLPCRADRSMLQILFNILIDNAVRYAGSSENRELLISCQPEGQKVEYCIRDNGIGITSGNCKAVFKIFYQERPDLSQGKGIGLAIACRIIERMGGEIRIHSEHSRYTQVLFSLPKASSAFLGERGNIP